MSRLGAMSTLRVRLRSLTVLSPSASTSTATDPFVTRPGLVALNSGTVRVVAPSRSTLKLRTMSCLRAGGREGRSRLRSAQGLLPGQTGPVRGVAAVFPDQLARVVDREDEAGLVDQRLGIVPRR